MMLTTAGAQEEDGMYYGEMMAMDGVLDAMLSALDKQIESQCDLMIRVVNSASGAIDVGRVQERLQHLSVRLSEKAAVLSTLTRPIGDHAPVDLLSPVSEEGWSTTLEGNKTHRRSRGLDESASTITDGGQHEVLPVEYVEHVRASLDPWARPSTEKTTADEDTPTSVVNGEGRSRRRSHTGAAFSGVRGILPGGENDAENVPALSGDAQRGRRRSWLLDSHRLFVDSSRRSLPDLFAGRRSLDVSTGGGGYRRSLDLSGRGSRHVRRGGDSLDSSTSQKKGPPVALVRTHTWNSASVMRGSLTARTIHRIRHFAVSRAWKQWTTVVREDKMARKHGLGWHAKKSLREPNTKRHDPGTISPLSRFFVAWTMLIILCLLYILVMQPFEAAYLSTDLLKEGEPLTVVNRCLDVIFLVDMYVNFKTGYFDEHDQEIRDPALIQRRYLRTWFWVDFASSAPPVVEVILLIVFSNEHAQATGGRNSLESAKVLKIARIFKAFKVLRFSKFVKLSDTKSPFVDRLEDFAATSSSKFLGKILFIIFFSFTLGHIIACCMAMSGDGWFETYHADNPDDPDRNASEWSWQRRYVLGLYWSFATMSTVGFGDVTPASDNERIFSIVAVSLGVGFYSYIVASVSSIVTANDAKSQLYYEKMDAIASWVAHHKLQRGLAHKIRVHFRQYYTARTALNEKDILQHLSPSLADEVTDCLLDPVLLRHPLFNWLPTGSAWKVLLICKKDLKLPGQVVIEYAQLTSSLFVLVDGRADCYVADQRLDQQHQRTLSSITGAAPSSSGSTALALPPGLIASGASATTANGDVPVPLVELRRKYIIGPGSSFGELAVLGIHHSSVVKVIARNRCSFYRIQQDGLLDAFNSMPEVLHRMRSITAPGGCRIVHP